MRALIKDPSFIKWFYFGMHIKRWLLLLLLGVAIMGLGIGYFLREVYVSYDAKIGQGPIYSRVVDHARTNTNRMDLCYEYPFQWSNTDDRIKHHCFVLPERRDKRPEFVDGDEPIPRPDRQAFAVLGERDATHPVPVILHAPALPARRQIPRPQRPVVAAADEQ